MWPPLARFPWLLILNLREVPDDFANHACVRTSAEALAGFEKNFFQAGWADLFCMPAGENSEGVLDSLGSLDVPVIGSLEPESDCFAFDLVDDDLELAVDPHALFKFSNHFQGHVVFQSCVSNPPTRILSSGAR